MTHIPFTSKTHCNFDDCDKPLNNSIFVAVPLGNFKICGECFDSKVMEKQMVILQEKLLKSKDRDKFVDEALAGNYSKLLVGE
tara:strand:+ start:1012 stop:1260 length:249 start_codon:yes stop_codon:yes gene_type:complete